MALMLFPLPSMVGQVPGPAKAIRQPAAGGRATGTHGHQITGHNRSGKQIVPSATARNRKHEAQEALPNAQPAAPR